MSHQLKLKKLYLSIKKKIPIHRKIKKLQKWKLYGLTWHTLDSKHRFTTQSHFALAKYNQINTSTSQRTQLFNYDFQVSIQRRNVVCWSIRLKQLSKEALLSFGVPSHVIAQLVIVPNVKASYAWSPVVLTSVSLHVLVPFRHILLHFFDAR